MKRQLRLESAWEMLDAHELVPARLTSFGIAVDLNGDFIQCGVEVLSHASMSIRNDVGNVRWFARFDFVEIADLIIAAYERCRGDMSRESIYRAVCNIDSEYDSTRLKQWLTKREFELPKRDVPDLS